MLQDVDSPSLVSRNYSFSFNRWIFSCIWEVRGNFYSSLRQRSTVQPYTVPQFARWPKPSFCKHIDAAIWLVNWAFQLLQERCVFFLLVLSAHLCTRNSWSRRLRREHFQTLPFSVWASTLWLLREDGTRWVAEFCEVWGAPPVLGQCLHQSGVIYFSPQTHK